MKTVNLNKGSLKIELSKKQKLPQAVLSLIDETVQKSQVLDLKTSKGEGVLKIYNGEKLLLGSRTFEGDRGERLVGKLQDKETPLYLYSGVCFFDSSSLGFCSKEGEIFSGVDPSIYKKILEEKIKIEEVLAKEENLTPYEFDTLARFLVKLKLLLKNTPDGKKVKVNFELPVSSYFFYPLELFENSLLDSETYLNFCKTVNKRKKLLQFKLKKISEILGVEILAKNNEALKIAEEVSGTSEKIKTLVRALKNGNLPKIQAEEKKKIIYQSYSSFLGKNLSEVEENSILLSLDNLSETQVGVSFSRAYAEQLKAKNLSYSGIYSCPNLEGLENFGGDFYLSEGKSKFQSSKLESLVIFYSGVLEEEILEILKN